MPAQHGTRCGCDACVDHRAEIRESALGRLKHTVQELQSPLFGWRHYRNAKSVLGIARNGVRSDTEHARRG